MLTKHIEGVNRYFLESVQKVYVERCTKIESFEEYLNHRYQDNGYYYSVYALMGLKSNDFLVRGLIDLDTEKNYHHGWVEFEFEGREYVFDSMCEGVVEKKEWEKSCNPRVDYKKTKKEILDEYLNERCAFKIEDGFWQFKYIVMNSETDQLSYHKIISNEKENGYVPTALMLSRVVINLNSSEITRFIAYSGAASKKKSRLST